VREPRGYLVSNDELLPGHGGARAELGRGALVEDGFVVLGGPVGDGVRVLLVTEAESARDVEARLAEDPWMPMGILRVARIEPWEVLLDGRGHARRSA
jgi:hypothetical protein